MLNVYNSGKMTKCNSISFLLYLFTTRYALGTSAAVSDLYQRNKMVVSKTLAQIPAIGINACAAECMAYTDCLSVNFNTEQLVCELNTDDANIVDDAQHRYMYATKSQLQTASKDCVNYCDMNCPSNHKCFIYSKGEATCIHTNCGEPPRLGNGKLKSLSKGRLFGSEAVYLCDNNYGEYGPTTSMCLMTGQWTDIGRCLQCSPAPPLRNAKYTSGISQAYGTVFTHTCKSDFEPVGNISTECRVDGIWSLITGYCKEICDAGFIEEVDGSGRPIGLCWQIFPDEKLTYAEATDTCRSRSRNGHLLALDTALKRHRVRSVLGLMSLSDRFKAWVNGQFSGTGYFYSTGGTCVGNWKSGEPRYSEPDRCLSVYPHENYLWKEKRCGNHLPFICESNIY